MVYEGFMAFGGNEVINSERLRGYAETSDCPPTWFRGDRCASLADALGHEEYLYSDIPLAPWYDPSLADVSSRFLGIQGLSISGLDDSTRSASSTEGIDDGGTLGRVRKGMRSVRARGTLMAQGRDALEYGISWLNSTLDPGACGQHGTRCGTTDMEYFADCPPERVDVGDFTEWEESARNLATNPSFEDSDGTVEVARNLVTNPSFEAGSGTVEVRRNSFLDPRASGLSAFTWLGSTSATGALSTIAVSDLPDVSDTAVRGTLTGTATTWRRIRSSTSYAVTAGQTWTLSLWMRSSRAIYMGARIQWLNSTGGQISETPYASQIAVPDQWARMVRTFVAPAGAVGANLYADVDSNQAGSIGDTLDATGWMFEQSNAVLPFFVPGLPSPDGDLTPSWTGAEDASASVLTGATIAGITTRVCLAIRSSKFGGSMRLIPTSAFDNSSYAEAQPYPGLLARQTLMATVHLEAPLSGSLGSRSRQLYSSTPLQGSPAAPNTAGSYPLRTVQTPTSQGRIIFYHGGLVGSGDVYWTEAGVIKGDYDGDYFDGNTVPLDHDLSASWEGVENESASILTAEKTAGVEAIAEAFLPPYRSQQWSASGEYSFRTEYICATYGFPNDRTMTIMATARLAGQILQSVTDGAFTAQAAVEGETLKITVPPAPSGGTPTGGSVFFTAVFDETQASILGPGWWDNLIIVEGDYQGDYFDGDSVPGDNVEDVRYAWAGEPGASESVMETREAFMRPQTDEEYAEVVDPLRRYLHDVSATSGPLRVEIFESNQVKDLWGATFEWTITSERAWIYSITRPVDLPVTETTVMESTPFNLVPYPSMTLAGDSVVIATNYSLNPSVETNADGWSYSFSTISGDTVFARDVEGGRVTGELQAVGGSSYRTRLYIQSGPASGRVQLNIQQDVDISTRDADSRVSISVWSALVRVGGSGDSAPVSLGGHLVWLDAAGVTVELVSLGEISDDPGFGGTVFSATSLPVPAGAVEARIIIQGLFDWVGPVDMRMYADALAVTVP